MRHLQCNKYCMVHRDKSASKTLKVVNSMISWSNEGRTSQPNLRPKVTWNRENGPPGCSIGGETKNSIRSKIKRQVFGQRYLRGALLRSTLYCTVQYQTSTKTWWLLLFVQNKIKSQLLYSSVTGGLKPFDKTWHVLLYYCTTVHRSLNWLTFDRICF